mmetsp:Transcript_11340/g.21483  ORF Transcript_11340/g.21483 Transcript_11340/m.21483 type:complete len:224 (+) Transcript_11340:447-1118(+)
MEAARNLHWHDSGNYHHALASWGSCPHWPGMCHAHKDSAFFRCFLRVLQRDPLADCNRVLPCEGLHQNGAWKSHCLPDCGCFRQDHSGPDLQSSHGGGAAGPHDPVHRSPCWRNIPSPCQGALPFLRQRPRPGHGEEDGSVHDGDHVPDVVHHLGHVHHSYGCQPAQREPRRGHHRTHHLLGPVGAGGVCAWAHLPGVRAPHHVRALPSRDEGQPGGAQAGQV